ncbi:sensor histidine kinase [Actinomadura atramentaria]|uniref:sensor histidine kinase n=1 Tax=Actinomadura atramentaria TaxID=1990 RepID=UPI0003603D0D|nr:HAMP domain-containing sensor histidine kinase [Actinomadura atramentaria]
MKLTTRFAVCVAVLVPVLVLLAGLLVLRLAAHDLRAERDRQLTARLRGLTPTATTYVQRTRLPAPKQAERAQRRVTGAAVDDGSGGVYVAPVAGEPLVIGGVPATLPANDPAGPATFTAGGERWRFVSTALGARGAAGRLWVFEPERRVADRVALLRRRLLAVTLVAAAAGALAGFGLARLAVRPLSALRGQARAIGDAPGSGRRLATASGTAEVDELARLVNELLDRGDDAVRRTAAALETARAFAATAAHELRTPLTSMGANLGLIDHAGVTDADRAEIVADLAAEHARMDRLVTMLRQLARGELLDAGSLTAVDLADLVEAAVEDARRRRPAAAITATVRDPAAVRGWPDGLRMVVDNLLDNAVVHGADRDGRADVRVALDSEPGAVTLRVRDHGRGIPDARRTEVFERFRRRPGSPGSGLGPTLVAQQARLHGGTVTVADPPDGPGTLFTVRFPRADR